MRLTTKGEYGVRAVVNLASKGAVGPVSIGQIAREEEVSPAFLEQIFFRLKKAGLIRSVRGPRGGFLLNRGAHEISIKSILDAVGEPLYPTPCTDHGGEPCKRRPSCPMSPIWHGFYDTMRVHLEGISLRDILANAASPARKGSASS